MRSFCDSTLCRARKFGIGRGGDFPVITSLSKLNTDPPIWFADVEGERLELSTEDLQLYQRFHRACMNKVNKSFRTMKQDAWLTVLAEAMDNLLVIEAPPDTHTSFHEHLEEFLTNRARGERVEDLWEGRPWESVEDGRYYFTIRSLEQYLKQQGLKMTRADITSALSKIPDAGSRFFNVKGKGINTRYVPTSQLQATPTVDPPKIKDEEQDI